MSIVAMDSRTEPLILDVSAEILSKDLSSVQICSVSVESSEDDSSTTCSVTSQSVDNPLHNRSAKRLEKWLAAKQQLVEVLELLHETIPDRNQGTDKFDDFEDEDVRLELQELALRAHKHFTLPHENLQTILQAHHVEAALRYAAHNRVAEQVPIQGSISYSDLAVNASVDVSQCKRILRLLSTYHIFAEDKQQNVIHTASSILLLDSNIQSWVEYSATDSIAGSLHLSEALAKWPGSKDPTQTAFNLSQDTNLSIFQYFAQIPGKHERFRRAMTGLSRNIASSPRHAAQGYNWADLRVDAKIVDVGGANGHVSRAILEANPSFEITVQDIGVASNSDMHGIVFCKYDFFTPQPIHHADVYFIRQVLHDWSDEFAVNIIRNQVSAMAASSKLVVMDMVMPEPGEWRLSEERRARSTDLTMLTLVNSEERNLPRWIGLMQSADQRLHLTNIIRPAGSILTLMEFSLR